MSAATILLVIMWLFAAVFFVVLVKDVLAHKNELDKSKNGVQRDRQHGGELL